MIRVTAIETKDGKPFAGASPADIEKDGAVLVLDDGTKVPVLMILKQAPQK